MFSYKSGKAKKRVWSSRLRVLTNSNTTSYRKNLERHTTVLEVPNICYLSYFLNYYISKKTNRQKNDKEKIIWKTKIVSLPRWDTRNGIFLPVMEKSCCILPNTLGALRFRHNLPGMRDIDYMWHIHCSLISSLHAVQLHLTGALAQHSNLSHTNTHTSAHIASRNNCKKASKNRKKFHFLSIYNSVYFSFEIFYNLRYRTMVYIYYI